MGVAEEKKKMFKSMTTDVSDGKSSRDLRPGEVK